MQAHTDRRKFLIASSALAASLAAPRMSWGSTPDREVLFKISLAEWSLHRTLRSGKLTNLDFPRVAKEEFGIEGIEYVNQFFKDKAEDEAYLGQLKQQCQDHGVTSVLIMIDGEGALGDANPAKREEAVKNHHRWVHAAKFLGCHAIRVNAKSAGSYQEQVERAAEGLRALAEYAQPHGINVIVENHGGLSSNGQWLAQVIRRVNLDNCGTLPDFGNFRIGKGQDGQDVWYDRYLGTSALMPFAKAVSAKSHEFDEQGNEVRTDYLKMMQIVLDAGYRGWVGIEYEGSQLDEYAGIKATKQLLEKCQRELTVG